MADLAAAHFLQSAGLESYIDKFKDEAVDFDAILSLDTAILKELIPPAGHRIKFLKALEIIRLEAASPVAAASLPGVENAADVKNDVENDVENVVGDAVNIAENIEIDVTPDISQELSAILPVLFIDPAKTPDAITPDTKTPDSTNSAKRTLTFSPLKAKKAKLSPRKLLLSPSKNSQRSFEFFINSYEIKDIPPKYIEKLKKCLTDTLSETLEGKAVLFAFQNKSAQSADRKRLAEILVAHAQNKANDLRISSFNFKLLALSISALFPAENCLTYYIPQVNLGSGKKICPKGRLYEKYQNKLKVFKKNGILLKTNPKEAEALEGSQPDSETGIDLGAETTKLDVEFLKTASGDQVQLIKEKWKSTSKVRLQDLHSNSHSQSIAEYIALYNVLSKPFALELIDIDFQFLHPDKENFLFLKWGNLSQKIYEVVKLKCSNAALKAFLNQEIPAFSVFPSLSIEEQSVIALILLASIIPGGQRSRTIKYSRKEVKDDFFLHIPNHQDLRAKLQERNEKLATEKKSGQPIPVLVGEDLKNLDCFVEINDHLYAVSSPLAAIDAVFKSCMVLNAKYSEPSEKVWLFLQRYVFKIVTKHDRTTSSIEELSASLEC